MIGWLLAFVLWFLCGASASMHLHSVYVADGEPTKSDRETMIALLLIGPIVVFIMLASAFARLSKGKRP